MRPPASTCGRTHPMWCDCPPEERVESSAYRWLRLVKVALASAVSFLTALRLLGLL